MKRANRTKTEAQERRPYRIGSLFSGIGLLEHGLERGLGGGEVMWQVEIEEFCRRVLAKHWPGTERFSDVRSFKPRGTVDVVCGGFPCTDISAAAHGVARDALQGDSSGLWFHFARIVSIVKPRWVVIENVAQWRSWLPIVRRSLYSLGYSSVPFQLPASHVGAPHARARVWVVAYPNEDGQPAFTLNAKTPLLRELPEATRPWPAPPSAVGMDDGGLHRVDRNHALGNGVVERCARVIGRIIRDADKLKLNLEAS